VVDSTKKGGGHEAYSTGTLGRRSVSSLTDARGGMYALPLSRGPGRCLCERQFSLTCLDARPTMEATERTWRM